MLAHAVRIFCPAVFAFFFFNLGEHKTESLQFLLESQIITFELKTTDWEQDQ